jgi:threonine dehydrogenase-like Zn-dependent dehydrogenase
LCLNARHLGDTDIPGGWGEFVAIDEDNAYPLPDTLDYTVAALTEPAAVCMESFKRADLREGHRVLIMGDGTFGFVHAMLARLYGASEIVVAGHYDQRLGRIREKTGATICNTHNEGLGEAASALGDRASFDVAIEATGATACPNMALEHLKPRGTLVLFSYVWHPDVLQLGLIHMKEISVIGACRSLNCFGECVDLMAAGKLDMGSLVDIKVPLDHVTDAMRRLKENKANVFKAVLIP